MAKFKDPLGGYIHHIENYIEKNVESTPELSDYIYDTKSTCLTKNDVVRVSYFKKLCRVTKVLTNSVKVTPLDEPNKTYTVKFKFVKMYEGNSKVAEVLYGSK